MNIRPCALIRRNDKYLFLTYDYSDGRLFALPGGGCEDGESLAETLIRELKEELNVNLKVGSLLWVCEMKAHGKIPETLHLVFKGSIPSDVTPFIQRMNTTASSLCWLSVDELKNKILYPNIGSTIKKEQFLPEKSTETYLGVCPPRKWV